MRRISCSLPLRSPLVGICGVMLFSTSMVHADIAIVQGSASGITQIRSDNPGNNYGADASLIVGKTATGGILHGLLSFDLSMIPAGATITDITLTLVSTGTGATTNQSGSVALNLHDLTGNFVEGTGTSGGTASTTSATWLRRDATNLWTTAGGDYDATILSSLNLDPTTNATGNVSIFASTAGFVTAAQSAFSTSTPFTLLLKLNDVNEAEAIRRPFFFASDEALTPANAPKLSVTYSIPEPGGSVMLIAGSIGLVARLRRRQ